MKISINGEPREVADGLTIDALLREMKIADRVAVEVNLEVVRRAHHADHRLSPGDKVEIVTFVGGG